MAFLFTKATLDHMHLSWAFILILNIITKIANKRELNQTVSKQMKCKSNRKKFKGPISNQVKVRGYIYTLTTIKEKENNILTVVTCPHKDQEYLLLNSSKITNRGTHQKTKSSLSLLKRVKLLPRIHLSRFITELKIKQRDGDLRYDSSQQLSTIYLLCTNTQISSHLRTEKDEQRQQLTAEPDVT